MNAPVDPVYLRYDTESEPVRALRRRVGNARVRCLSRAELAISCDVGTFMLRAAQIAAAWSFAPATQDQLEDVIVLVTALHVAANAAERLEAREGESE